MVCKIFNPLLFFYRLYSVVVVIVVVVVVVVVVFMLKLIAFPFFLFPGMCLQRSWKEWNGGGVVGR